MYEPLDGFYQNLHRYLHRDSQNELLDFDDIDLIYKVTKDNI